jgi:hypothetical protein
MASICVGDLRNHPLEDTLIIVPGLRRLIDFQEVLLQALEVMNLTTIF